jgi:hypothetical protein
MDNSQLDYLINKRKTRRGRAALKGILKVLTVRDEFHGVNETRNRMESPKLFHVDIIASLDFYAKELLKEIRKIPTVYNEFSKINLGELFFLSELGTKT